MNYSDGDAADDINDIEKVEDAQRRRCRPSKPPFIQDTIPLLRPEIQLDQRRRGASRIALLTAAASIFILGCTGPLEYFRNGLKVGPNYRRPAAPIAGSWIDASDERVGSLSGDLSNWWTVFADPTLNDLVYRASRQNLTLRQAGFRVLEARAQYGISRGNFFPQVQNVQGDYYRQAQSRAQANRGFLSVPYYQQIDIGFASTWEIDFWGRFRRAIESSEANLNASVESYDDVLVTLLGDVASNYVRLRTIEQQLVYVATNIQLQRETLDIAKARFQGGDATELDVEQAQSVLSQTESQIPQLEIQRRQTSNALCVLLGIPTTDLETALGRGPIPHAPAHVAIGIPADLLRRRPDVRRQERLAAAQAASIGVAEADFYPAFSLTGNIGWGAADFSDLFTSRALQGTFGPSFRWNVLNYGRILNNVRLQDARFQELVASYQQSVLQANRETEDGLIQFLRSQQQAMYLAASVAAAEKAVQVAAVQYKGGLVDYNRVATLQQNLVQQQNLFAQAQSSIALGLIQVYRALGGGWDIRLGNPAAMELLGQTMPPHEPAAPAPEPLPVVPPGNPALEPKP